MTELNQHLRLIYIFLGTLLLGFWQTEAASHRVVAHPTASLPSSSIQEFRISPQFKSSEISSTDDSGGLYPSFFGQNSPAEVDRVENSCSPTLNEEQALNLSLLSENAEELDNSCSTDTITKDTICQTRLTIPSLWWADEQFGDKLLENWLAYPEEHRVDLVVNRQIWGLMDYYQRYAFVHRMVAVVRENGETGENGYNLRVFNRQEPELCLAAYTCNANNCQLKIRDFGPRSSG
ncbi:MAG: hypothetical protein WBB29_08080 [Geitlerinemataceae cyanobacterium]